MNEVAAGAYHYAPIGGRLIVKQLADGHGAQELVHLVNRSVDHLIGEVWREVET
jgi:hypothetical protein